MPASSAVPLASPTIRFTPGRSVRGVSADQVCCLSHLTRSPIPSGHPTSCPSVPSRWFMLFEVRLLSLHEVCVGGGAQSDARAVWGSKKTQGFIRVVYSEQKNTFKMRLVKLPSKPDVPEPSTATQARMMCTCSVSYLTLSHWPTSMSQSIPQELEDDRISRRQKTACLPLWFHLVQSSGLSLTQRH